MATYAMDPGCITRVTMFGRYQDSTILNVFHYAATLPDGYPDGPAAVRGLMSQFQTVLWAGAWQDAVNDEYILTRLQGQLVYNPTLMTQIPRVSEEIVVNEFGSVAVTTALPSNIAADITRKGSLPGRGRNSTLHIAGQDATQLSGSQWSAAYMLLLNAVGNAMFQVLTDVGRTMDYTPVIWSKQFQTVQNVVRDAVPRSFPRTMRRRGANIGI